MTSKEGANTEKRRPPNAGKGRPKGTQNKITADVKAMILGALNDAGGQAYLLAQAHENPKAFLTLVGRVLPLQVSGGGENGEIEVAVIKRVVVDK